MSIKHKSNNWEEVALWRWGWEADLLSEGGVFELVVFNIIFYFIEIKIHRVKIKTCNYSIN